MARRFDRSDRSQGKRKVPVPKAPEPTEVVHTLSVDYATRELCGWVGIEIAREHFALLGGDLQPFHIISSQGDYHGKRQMLWEFTRKALGKDTENYAQQIGDCHDVNTDVLMSSGKCKPIAEVQVGDYVVTHLNNNKRVSRKIKKKYNGRLYSLKAKKHYKPITSTADHEYISYHDEDMNRGEWKSISTLDIDSDSILVPFTFREVEYEELIDRDNVCQRGTRARHPRKNNLGHLREIEYLTYEEVKDIDVYCLEVEDDHSFIANGYAVSNCTSFGAKNVMEYLQCVQIALAGEAQKFRNMFPPYFYGCSRVFIGGGQIGGDGGSGTWIQAAIKKYGALATDDPNVPPYSGRVAREWGGHRGPPKEFVSLGQQHLVKTTAQITNADDAANALLNGYPIAICSDRGYNMMAGSDGFHAPKGSWSHCMSLIGFDDSDSSKGLYFIILNSWGDVHGQLKDFSTNADLPVGILRVKGEYVDKMLAQEDSFAFSQFDGFPDNSKNLEKALFDVVGSYWEGRKR